MLSRIVISRKWQDEDVALLAFEVSDGASVFLNEVYAPPNWAANAAVGLSSFARQVHGGLFDLIAGEQGPEYASGFFRARFHYFKPTSLLISVEQEGEFHPFKDGNVASAARLFLRTEPALLDRFVAALSALDAPDAGEAILECVHL